ncbi:hypothetical protein E4O93_18510 [Diaphorobacter sp. DS2]|uniref:Uncharacterized protein n=1 Tax=Cytobacillus oceanisediminis TaxID=665099 RepID=A0ABX3CNE2_9BACI|nr:hypothetical protein [Cytobacillus oceanisediminis]OHX44771.1 hypothetical protein BBV17_25030 [Cytobacillus oceanisediminis]TFI46315.1 hypothetical protein E4O93_18510 [Diaphorobacter sp. DS2]
MNDKLNKGIPSDRLLLEWDLLATPVVNAANGIKNSQSHWGDYPLYLNYSIDEGLPVPGNIEEIRNDNGVLIPIPKVIQNVKVKFSEIAADWRMKVRVSVTGLLADGYIIKGVLVDSEMGYYVLERIEGES